MAERKINVQVGVRNRTGQVLTFLYLFVNGQLNPLNVFFQEAVRFLATIRNVRAFSFMEFSVFYVNVR